MFKAPFPIILFQVALATIVKSALDLHPTGAALPFAVHLPVQPISPPYPAVLSLHGNGSVGGVEMLSTRTLWDAAGPLISKYDSGNRTGAQQILAEQFLTILPLAPVGTVRWDPAQVLEVLKVASSLYPIDANRVTLTGYSLGSTAVWSTAFQSPSSFADIVPSAGGYGFSDADLSKLLAVTPPVSVWAFAGTTDTKQPLANIEATIAQLRALPGAASTNIVYQAIDGDHSIMTSVPFLELNLWQWILAQSRSGGSNANTNTSSSVATSTSPLTSVAAQSTQLLATSPGPTVISSISTRSSSAASVVDVPTSITTITANSGGGRQIHFWWQL